VGIVLIFQMAESAIQISVHRSRKFLTVHVEAGGHPLLCYVISFEFPVANETGEVIGTEVTPGKEND
jgi:hypothetical protein